MQLKNLSQKNRLVYCHPQLSRGTVGASWGALHSHLKLLSVYILNKLTRHYCLWKYLNSRLKFHDLLCW